VDRNAPGGTDFILQMDIEGSEYSVLLDSSPATLRKFRIMAVEFHGLDALFDRGGFDLVYLTFAKVLRDFDIVHIHPNNWLKPVACRGYEVPPAMEFTFLRKDRIGSRRPALSFPHPTDRANFPQLPDIPLPGCWYRQDPKTRS
jgi:hypothetical protein